MTEEITMTSRDKAQSADAGGQTKIPRCSVISTEDFRGRAEQFPRHKELMRSLSRSIRYCKAEAYQDCVIGTIRVPQKKDGKEPAFTFAYYLTEQSLVLIENEGRLRTWLSKHAALFPQTGTPAQLLVALLKQMTDDDLLYLLHIETETEQMEEEIEHSSAENFFAKLTKRRHKLSELNAYYIQLREIGEFLQSDVCQPIVQNEQEWDRFTHRAERLQGHVQLLRENMTQLRELFQSVQDARQNRTMGIITIITTVFFPLSLLTGWYGMNFVNMPELQWEYSYFVMIFVVAVIVIAEIIYFKKKKFF